MSEERPWFVIAGGGTGGHLYPGLAVAEALTAIRPEFQVCVFGTPRPIDRRLTEPRKIELVAQPVRPLPRGKPWLLFGFLADWIRSVRDAKRRFKKRPPAVVLGLGGYAAAPPVVAASRLGIPTALFNPDARPGVANQRLASRANRIFVQWRETAEHFKDPSKVRCTGCPIRSGFLQVKREEAIPALKLDAARKTLLVTGASQGAWSINAAVIQLCDLFNELGDWQIIHLTGDQDLELCRRKYAAARVPALTLAFTENMPACMAAADLIISRAGASTLAEITAMGLPSILMPYPFDRKKHQLANARMLEECNAAIVVEDTGDPVQNADNLVTPLKKLMGSGVHRDHMAEVAGASGRLDAAQSIAEGLLQLAGFR